MSKTHYSKSDRLRLENARMSGPLRSETRSVTRFEIWTSLRATTWAFSHGLCHVSATKTDGGQLDMWWRKTVCFRKIEGKWMVTHEHNSVPFDPKSGKASLDLKP